MLNGYTIGLRGGEVYMALLETTRGGFEEEPYPDAIGYTVEASRDQAFLYEHGIMSLGRLVVTPPPGDGVRAGDGVMIVVSGAFDMAGRHFITH